MVICVWYCNLGQVCLNEFVDSIIFSLKFFLIWKKNLLQQLLHQSLRYMDIVTYLLNNTNFMRNEVQWRGFRHRRTRVFLPQIHFSLSKHRLCCHVPSAFTRRKNDQQYSIWRHRSRTIQDMLRFIYTGKVLKMDSFAAGLVITGSKYLLR